MISERQAVNAVLHQLLQRQGNLQMEILIRERFGDEAITPFMAKAGYSRHAEPIKQLIADSRALANDIRELQAALDKARDASWSDFVAELIRRKKGEA